METVEFERCGHPVKIQRMKPDDNINTNFPHDDVSIEVIDSDDVRAAKAYLREQLELGWIDLGKWNSEFLGRIAYYIVELGCKYVLDQKVDTILCKLAAEYSFIEMMKGISQDEKTT